jgi:DNA mismatch repair protein PMS2
MTHLQTPASPALRSNFSSLFAPKALQAMLELDLDLEVAADKSVLKWTEGAAS